MRQFLSILNSEFEVVATAVNGALALQSIRRCRPDVVVLDLRMPVLDGLELTRILKSDRTGPAVVICSVESEPEIVEAAVQAGAMGYVLKTQISRDLIAAVKLVAQGKSFIPSDNF